MGLADTQALLAKLFTDKHLRKQFFEDPIAVGTALGLDNGQAAILAGLDPTGVAAFADSLDRKRRDDLAKFLPITTRALADKYNKVFHRFANEHQERPGSLGDAQAFVDFFTELAKSAEGPFSPWLGDLARYEIAFQRTVMSPRNFLILGFHYPVQQIATLVLQDLPMPLIQRRRTVALWCRIGSRGRLRHLVFSLFPWNRGKSSLTSYSPASRLARSLPESVREFVEPRSEVPR